MPFTVTRPHPNGKLYIREQFDGELFWTPTKTNATPFAVDQAERIARTINAIASTPCQVEGIKHNDEVTP